MPVRRKIKNTVCNYSAAELLVRDATSNDPNIPDETTLIRIADCTKLPVHFSETTGMIWKRLNDKSKNWRHVYKALIVIEACLQYGGIEFVKECESQLPQISTLCDFEYVYDGRQDFGRLVREKAKRVVKLLKDDNLLKEERRIARVHRDTFRPSRSRNTSMSSDKTGGSGARPRRVQSVFNPSTEFVAKNDSEEEQQIKLAMSMSLQDAAEKKAHSDIGRPTILASAMKANNVKEDNLLDLSDSTPRAKGFNGLLDARYKKGVSVADTDFYQPTSAMADERRGMYDRRATLPTYPGEFQSSLFDELGEIDFTNPIEVPPVAALSGDPLASFGPMLNELNSSGILSPSASSTTLRPPDAHKTSADDYFDSLEQKEKKQPSQSQLANLLGGHTDLVDLDNIINPKKPPPSNGGLVGSNLFNDTAHGKPSLFELGAPLESNHNWNRNPMQPAAQFSANQSIPTISMPQPPMAFDPATQPMAFNPAAQPMPFNPAAQPMAYNQSAQPMAYNQSAQPMAYNQSAQPMAYNQSAQQPVYSQYPQMGPPTIRPQSSFMPANNSNPFL